MNTTIVCLFYFIYISDCKNARKFLNLSQVPLHLMSKWDSFYLEILLALGLCVYFANFMYGRSKNARLASTWFHANKQILTQHFALVGEFWLKRNGSSLWLIEHFNNFGTFTKRTINNN